jgi:hypothetical protein
MYAWLERDPSDHTTRHDDRQTQASVSQRTTPTSTPHTDTHTHTEISLSESCVCLSVGRVSGGGVCLGGASGSVRRLSGGRVWPMGGYTMHTYTHVARGYVDFSCVTRCRAMGYTDGHVAFRGHSPAHTRTRESSPAQITRLILGAEPRPQYIRSTGRRSAGNESILLSSAPAACSHCVGAKLRNHMDTWSRSFAPLVTSCN